MNNESKSFLEVQIGKIILNSFWEGSKKDLFTWPCIQMYSIKTKCSAGPWITSFYSTSFHCNIDEGKKSVPSQDLCRCRVYTFFPCLRGFFSRYCGFLPHPRAVTIWWTGMSKWSQDQWLGVCVSATYDGRASCPGLVPTLWLTGGYLHSAVNGQINPWASRIGSSDPWLGWHNWVHNSLTCFY